MAEVFIQGKNLKVQMKGLRKIFALKRELTIPLEHIKKIVKRPDVFKEPPKVLEKRLGTNLYGIYMGGSFKQKGVKSFWDVRHPERTIIVYLKHEKFDRLIIDVDDPKRTIKMIKKALKKTT